MELSQRQIKVIMNNWVSKRIAEYRAENIKLTRAMLAQELNVTQSCFSQYLNPAHPKASTWEFQVKLASLLHESIRVLHPELIDLSHTYFR